jgi:hypothetical protein
MQTTHHIRQRIALALAWSVLIMTQVSTAQPQGYNRAPFQAGERLRYKVSWHFIRLGTMVIQQQLAEANDTSKFVVKMHAESDPSLSFINVFFANQSLLLSHAPTNLDHALESGRGKKTRKFYRYDSTSKCMVMETYVNGQIIDRGSLAYDGAYYDAVGLFMLIRCLSGSGLTFSAPTISGMQLKNTELRFTNEVREFKTGALKQPVKGRRLEGKIGWVDKSSGGMTGVFNVWISDDEAAIPLKAEFRISLGAIALELEDYSRPHWPKADMTEHVGGD